MLAADLLGRSAGERWGEVGETMRARTLVLGVALASVLSGVGPMALAGGFMILAGLVITASGVLLACPEGGRRQKRTS